MFFTSIAMIIFSSLIYYVERGVYNEDLGMWMRIYVYYCEVKAWGGLTHLLLRFLYSSTLSHRLDMSPLCLPPGGAYLIARFHHSRISSTCGSLCGSL